MYKLSILIIDSVFELYVCKFLVVTLVKLVMHNGGIATLFCIDISVPYFYCLSNIYANLCFICITTTS